MRNLCNIRKNKQQVPYPCRGQVWMIPTADIQPNPRQPRREFPLEGLVELAQSISENGILQPLTVSFEDGQPVLIAAGCAPPALPGWHRCPVSRWM